MKKLKIAVAILAIASVQNVKAQTMELKTQTDSISYAIGVSVGANLKTAGLDGLSTDMVAKAMSASLKGEALLMDAAKANQVINDYMTAIQAKKGESSKTKGAAFLAENKKKKGVITLPDGLQYEIIKEGTGPKPTTADKVKVHYHGTLIDGTVFDSSVQRGEPATFGVTQVIKGWTEVLLLMPVGSKWKIYLPYDLAYGDKGAGGQIGPYETLIFEVELLEIVKDSK